MEYLLLPEDIIREILVRLPAKSLLRFRCVSKSWLSLIDSKQLIETHSAHQRVLIFIRGLVPLQCSLLAFFAGNCLSPLSLDLIPRGPVYSTSCCNGLVCIYQNERFLLLNPYTRVSKELPQDPEMHNVDRDLSKTGFGWDESSDAYKVFAGWNCMSMGRVHSSKTNSWKTVDNPHTYGKDGTFVGGMLHWLSETTISSFDVKTEVFRSTKLPCEIESQSRFRDRLGVVGGCLGLIHLDYNDNKKPFDIWVMKENGVRLSWEKLPTVPLANVQISIHACLIGEAANGEILIAFGNSLLAYCPMNGVIQERRRMDSFFTAQLCVKSLVSPVREISSI